MSQKAWVTIATLVGSVVGGYIPSFFGAGILSFWGLIGSTIGGIVGIWVGFKLYDIF